MGWLDRFRSRQKKEGQRRAPRVETPYCSMCEAEIVNLDISVGDMIEDQGAFLYSGSEGTLYEPVYSGSICLGCGTKICDDCLDKQVDKTRCPKCGGSLRAITPKRLPKAK